MDNLTPQLNDTQLKQNIDALTKQNVPVADIQSYVDKYSKSESGNYVLKQDTNENTKVSQADSLTSGRMFGQSLDNAEQKAKDTYGENSLAYGATLPARAVLRTGAAIGDFLTGSTQEFGRTIGESTASVGNSDLFAQASQNHDQIMNSLQDRIRTNKLIGKDTSKLESALSQLQQEAPKQEDFTGDVINKSGLQVAGEALGTFGDIAGLGTYGKGFVAGGKALNGANILENIGLKSSEKILPTTISLPLKGAGIATETAGRVMSKAGSKAVESVIPVSSREAGLIQAYRANKSFLQRIGDVLRGAENAPTTVGKTTAEKTIFGTKSQIGVQANKAAGTLWSDVVSPALKRSDVSVNIPKYLDEVEQTIKSSVSEKTRQNSLIEALNSVKEDYKDVANISLEELQNLKEGWAKFVPEKVYNGKPIAGALSEVRNLLAVKARKYIYDSLGPEVRKAYFDYGNLKGLQEYGKKALTGEKLKGGAGSFISEILSQAVTPIATIGGQVIYRTGKGLEFVGKQGARIVSDVLR